MILMHPCAIGNFMINTPGEPARLEKFLAVASKYGWTVGRLSPRPQPVRLATVGQAGGRSETEANQQRSVRRTGPSLCFLELSIATNCAHNHESIFCCQHATL
jgi:hypothetical protein